VITSRRTARGLAALGLAAALAGSLAVGPATSAAAQDKKAGRLGSGEYMRTGAVLNSPDGHYHLVMQDDGNLVEYVGGRPLWATGTHGHPGAFAAMQTDGNLVVYTPGGTPLWSSKTYGNPGAYLVIRNDANLRVMSASGGALWSPHVADYKIAEGQSLKSGWFISSPDGKHRLVMTTDGDLVLQRGKRVKWQTKTGGHPGSTVTMQSDGNLVVRTPGGTPLWDSKTAGNPHTYLEMDGKRALLYAPGGVVIWTSKPFKHKYVVKDRDDIAEVKKVGHQMAADRGWRDPSEFSCLDQLWDKESGWRWNADNPYSEAYGIPQANPGSKMAEAGKDWHGNPVTQMKWGLGYIGDRYGSPCAAWAFWQSHGWYAGEQ
jgi:hypothetical protein